MDLMSLEETLVIQLTPVWYSLITLVVALVLRLIVQRAIISLSEEGFFDLKIRNVFIRLVNWLIGISFILLVLGFFGLSVAALWASVTGIVALIALGFVAVWSVLSNILCSILMIIFPPFRIGDEIEIQEPSNEFFVRGKVHSINMIFTSLSTSNEDGEIISMIRIPNSIFFQKYVRCFPGKKTQSLKGFLASEYENKND
jgi:small-conductance mechanosensitive channel